MQINHRFLLIFLITIFTLPSVVVANNQLYNHASPYLAMHGNDPVNWMEWGNEAIEKARKEKKLLFVSIGYYACHWCHVMHRESYANPAIAKILNEHFIAVKVDRELNPVLDKRLIDFVQATTGTAGWPLNVFITPEGYPLVGTTYLPRSQFAMALTRLNKQWEENSLQLQVDAKAMNRKLLASMMATDTTGDKKHIAENAHAFIQQAMRQANTLQGGFSHVRQFPSASQLLALLHLNKKVSNKDVDSFMQLSLDNMQEKGLHDEIAGGFYRYTTDPDWHTPHFEKMLYTNALLPLVYQAAAEQYKNNSYHQTALETLHFLLSDMQGKNGAFIASLSAVDDRDVEGGYYLWTQDELSKVLNKDELKLANLAWGLNQAATSAAGNLPIVQLSLQALSKKLEKPENTIQEQLSKLKTKLNKYRKQHRTIPKDGKLLAGWNGLTLAAFAKMLKFDNSLRPAGEKLSRFLVHLWDGKTLRRAKLSKKSGNLNDYAAVAWGLVQWGKATNNQKILDTGKQILGAAWQKFYTGNSWQESEKSLLPNPLFRQHIEDNAIPSSEALLLEATRLSGSDKWDSQVKQVLTNSTKDIENSPFSYAYLIAISSYSD